VASADAPRARIKIVDEQNFILGRRNREDLLEATFKNYEYTVTKPRFLTALLDKLIFWIHVTPKGCTLL
jgi:hypothetical protein